MTRATWIWGAVTRSEQDAVCTYLQESTNILGSVECARGALVRQVPPAEEPAESAAKEPDDCATRASAEEGNNLEWNNNDSTTQPEEGQLGRTLPFFLGRAVELTAQTPAIESAAKETASAEKTPIGGRSVARAVIAREPEGIWTTGGRLEDGSLQRTTGQVNASYTAFLI